MAPVYTPRGVVSISAMIPMVLTFGAPVIDAHGKSAARTPSSDPGTRAVTVDVICRTVGNFSISHRRGTCTVPISATLPMSLRIMSTIMRFSARFFSESRSHAALWSSSPSVRPRGAVPFIGRDTSVPSFRVKNSSGDTEQIAHLPRSMNAA